MLEDNEEVAVGRVESLMLIHRLPRGENKDTEAGFHNWIPGASDEVQTVDPVDGRVEIERGPAELVGDLVELRWCSVVGRGFTGGKGGMAGSGQDTVEPGLSVFMTRRSERRARDLFGVKTVWGFLGIISANW